MSKASSLIPQSLYQSLQALSGFGIEKVVVGLSGGLDSVALLHALSEIQEKVALTFCAVHVNHMLQRDAHLWSDFCSDLARELNIHFYEHSVNLPERQLKHPNDSVEALAREARYAIFAQYMHKQTALMTAHHANDQVETFFLQLMRGAGAKGLQAMPQIKPFLEGQHVRPFLHLKREQLEAYVEHNKLSYVNDMSNADERFDRNYLRHTVLPTFQERWPSYHKSVLSSIQNLASQREVLKDSLKLLHPEFFSQDYLEVTDLLCYTKDKQVIMLRMWLEKYCALLPPRVRLNEFLQQINTTKADAKCILVWERYALSYYQGALFVIKNSALSLEHSRSLDCSVKEAETYFLQVIEPDMQHLELPEDLGTLEVKGAIEECRFNVRFRRGGESIRLFGQTFHRSLKKLLNEAKIFPWERSRIPLIYDENCLVAVGDLWINADWLEQRNISDFSVFWHNRPRLTKNRLPDKLSST